MNIITFDKKENSTDVPPVIDFSRLQWVDFSRTEADQLGKLDELLHFKHRSDLFNNMHPPFFEQTDDYEMLIFRAIDNRYSITEIKTRSIAFLICGNSVITFHDEDDQTLSGLLKKWKKKKQKPSDVLSLLHSILEEIVTAFQQLREPLYAEVATMQKRLLDPNDPYDDWHHVLQTITGLRGLYTNLELQVDNLLSWRENTRYQLNESHTIKFNDLQDHLGRIERLSDKIISDLDSLVQIYFASSGQKTNVNVQFLAVVSAIFLPLNFIAGIFGMNFETIPLLGHPLGPFIIIGFMAALTGFLLWWFKKKKWY